MAHHSGLSGTAGLHSCHPLFLALQAFTATSWADTILMGSGVSPSVHHNRPNRVTEISALWHGNVRSWAYWRPQHCGVAQCGLQSRPAQLSMHTGRYVGSLKNMLVTAARLSEVVVLLVLMVQVADRQ